MKLEDFVHENGTVNAIAGGENVGYYLDAPLPKNLHVAGECRDCKHYQKADRGGKRCTNDKVYFINPYLKYR